jgi:hypothetical protein
MESLLCEHSAVFSATWPTSGMTRRGSVYELPMSAHRMAGSGSSSSRNLATPTASIAKGGFPQDSHGKRDLRLDLLPTPTVSDANGSGTHGDGGPDLRTTVAARLPTPDATHGRKTTRTGDLLPGGVEKLLPTPRATDGEKGGPNQRGSGGDLMLTSAVILLPTPTAQDSGNTPADHLRKKPGRTQVTSLQVICEHGLLPTGGRIAPPSPDGNTP